ncbi:hypothetical protein [Streptomyces luteocolor]|nr:hypothetical protein [Streptomyces luteocolor]
MSRVLALLELLFVALALAGIGLLSVPVALIVGGVLGVVAIERKGART